MADVAERPAGGEPEVDRENPLCRASRSRFVRSWDAEARSPVIGCELEECGSSSLRNVEREGVPLECSEDDVDAEKGNDCCCANVEFAKGAVETPFGSLACGMGAD